MSRLYQTDLETNIGTKSVGPIIDNVRQMIFTWHVNPLEFYNISESRPLMTNDEGDTFISFGEFIEIVSKCQIQEVDIND